ncbi:hypothetical protein D7J84_28190 (plasmid) [Bacillus thuringiensis]|uniref:Uncharacterized protein n=1 Tax=Bacillus thuringiensis TaxID=1428 RepID=A0A9W3YKF8_BACTU|nr:hypothetical protein D7J84_28190 [Bacillus thuringiensis]PNK35400.1 hypothetical protein CBR55_25400 [Bacillus thuringiensis]
MCKNKTFFYFCTNEWDRTIHHIRIFDYNEALYVIVILKCFEIQVINSLKTGELRTIRNITMLKID